jgi:hypothetical protein
MKPEKQTRKEFLFETIHGLWDLIGLGIGMLIIFGGAFAIIGGIGWVISHLF